MIAGARGWSMKDRDRFRLDVVLMNDPCLWRWDIRDELGGVIVHSSWEEEWTAYASRDDAHRAGEHELERLVAHEAIADA